LSQQWPATPISS